MSHVQLRNIRKAYGSHVALKDVSLSIDRGAFFTLLGPSGCGKTTLLRAIAGFHQQDAGDILLEGQSISHLGANKRNVGMVFQDYAVFPHLSVFDNVAFGLVQQKLPAAEIRERVGAILGTVQLDQHAAADAAPTERRPAATRGTGTGAGDSAQGVVDGRTAVQPRRQAARRAPARHPVAAAVAGHHHRVRHARSGRGAFYLRSGLRDARRRGAAGGHALDRLQPSCQPVRGDLCRQQQLHSRTCWTAAGQPLVLGQSLEVPKSVRSQDAKGLVASIRPERIVVNEALSEPGVHVGGVVRQAMFTGRELQLTVEVAGHGLLDVLTEPSAAMIALKPGDPVQLGVRGCRTSCTSPPVSPERCCNESGGIFRAGRNAGKFQDRFLVGRHGRRCWRWSALVLVWPIMQVLVLGFFDPEIEVDLVCRLRQGADAPVLSGRALEHDAGRRRRHGRRLPAGRAAGVLHGALRHQGAWPHHHSGRHGAGLAALHRRLFVDRRVRQQRLADPADEGARSHRADDLWHVRHHSGVQPEVLSRSST